MERTTLDLWVGIFIVAGIAALVVLAFKVGNLSTYNVSQSYTLQANFSNIGGLKPQASGRHDVKHLDAGLSAGRKRDRQAF